MSDNGTPFAGARLLVLAASINQLPIIRRARELGCTVLTADNQPQNIGHALADESFTVDTRNTDAIVALARENKIDGVIAAATDVALPSAAAVGAALGLRAPSPEAAQALVPKDAFRRLQRELGLPSPFATDSPGYVEGNGPFVVKPVVGSGSRGIRIVEAHESLDDAFQEAQKLSLNGKAIIERFLPGTQHSLEGILSGGLIRSCMVTDRLTAPPPFTATRGHRAPSALPPSACANVVEQIQKVFNYLEYRDGPFDADIVSTPQGPVIIELTPRAGGNALMRLIEAATGSDHVMYLIANALGMDVSSFEDFKICPAGVEILGSPRPGILTYNVGAISALKHESWCHYLALDLPSGSPVSAFSDGRARFGELIVTGRDRKSVDLHIEEALARLELSVS
ncbi:ATP-grasp domain-containing protein [Microvirga sp. M2]|uniref:ATP-grasp domain-containing protein n=1 Tax=Microvirga sp. M2 TaxID=3073270 RepID=UPI0039C40B8D